MWNASLQTDYDSLVSGNGYAPLSNHFLIQLAGSDRQRFLHSFCTADIKQLAAGQCTEAFILNPKGKTLAFVQVLAFENHLWLVGAVREHATTVIEHLDRYLIREDVQITDLSETTAQLFAPSDRLLTSFGQQPLPENECREATIDQVDVSIAAIEIAGLGILIACKASDSARLTQTLQSQPFSPCSVGALEAVRIEQRTPWSGSEANESNLPQELQRDHKAISFNKGCYLGQETVARLDALGRVNQLLVALQFSDASKTVEAGTELFDEEKSVGRVTSVAWSPQSKSFAGLGYVRRAFAKPATELSCAGNKATVTSV